MQVIKDYLNELGILNDKIDHKTLDNIVQNGSNREYVTIASGIMPEDGKNAEIKYYFSQKEKQLVEDDDGSISHYDVKNVNNVRKGQVIAEKNPPEDGQDSFYHILKVAIHFLRT